MTTGVHNAAASAAGYQHQTRWALVNLLREGRQRPDPVLSLEMHDDVAWADADGYYRCRSHLRLGDRIETAARGADTATGTLRTAAVRAAARPRPKAPPAE